MWSLHAVSLCISKHVYLLSRRSSRRFYTHTHTHTRIPLYPCFPLVSLAERGETSLEVGGRLAAGGGAGGGDCTLGPVPEERRKRSREELRELWKKAVLQQILLLRMERENQKLQGKTHGQGKVVNVVHTHARTHARARTRTLNSLTHL